MPGPERELPVLVSACLLGQACRYDGRHNLDGALERELAARGERAVPFCPEEHGGLGTPRPPAWITRTEAGAARVVTAEGHDVTEPFHRGADGALELCRREGIQKAYLKERSPSCGVATTHVENLVTRGPGITTARLRAAGIETLGVEGRRD
ncbi:MAG: DUF523 domain-containing protein [Planctomycetota bacterium]